MRRKSKNTNKVLNPDRIIRPPSEGCKNCSKCAQDKPIEEFTKTSSHCLQCRKDYDKEWRAIHRPSKPRPPKKIKPPLLPKRIKIKVDKPSQFPKNPRKEKLELAKTNPKIAFTCVTCRQEKPSTDFTKTSSDCKECRAKYHEKWRAINRPPKPLLFPQPLEYYENRRLNQLKKQREYFNKYYNSDPHFKFSRVLRTRIYHALKANLKKNLKSASTFDLIGCEIEEFIKHLESLFKPGMSWDNYGKGDDKWEIDHIIPCSWFDLSIPEEQRKCFHFSNMQPLWGIENRIKHDNFSG